MPQFPNLDKTLREIKIEAICDSYGQSENDLMAEAIMDGVSAGICVNPQCDNVVAIEPDSADGYCEECDTNTVWSILCLRGII